MDKADKAFSQARDYAYRLLEVRPRSITEMRQRLRRKGYTDAVIAQLIEYLKQLNYLNDLEFARSWTRSRMSTKPIGKMLLSYQLKSKGVSSQVVEKVISELEKDYNEQLLAVTLARHRVEKFKKQPQEKFKRRLYGYLRRRGFSYQVVSQAVKAVFKDYEQQ